MTMRSPEQLVNEALIRAKESAEKERREHADKRIKIYKDNYKSIVENEIDKQFSEKTRDLINIMPDDTQNVMKRVINSISTLYKGDVKRKAVIESVDNNNAGSVVRKEDERYNLTMKRNQTNLKMPEVNKYTNLLNECLVYIVPDKDIGVCKYNIITPNIVEVVQNEDDPTKADAIIYSRSLVDTVEDTDITYVYWDVMGQHFHLNKDGVKIPIADNPDNVNPYINPLNPERTIIPITTFHKTFPVDSFFEATEGNDLYSATIGIAVWLTYMNHIMKFNTFRQLVFQNVSIDDQDRQLILDPAYPIKTKGDGTVKALIHHNSGIKDIWAIIQSKISAIANNYGMSMDNFRLSSSASSGFSLKVQKEGLIEVREAQIPLFREYENELFEKTRIVNNTQFEDKISEESVFGIDFPEFDPQESAEEVRKQWKFDISIGAKSIYDYIKFKNPDIKTDEQAKNLLKKNDEINKEIKDELGIDVKSLLEKTLQDEPTTPGTSTDEGLV